MLTAIQYWILKSFFPRTNSETRGDSYERRSKLDILLGPEFLAAIQGKFVIDFGCGEGLDAVEMAQRGAGRVMGIDIRNEVLEVGRAQASAVGVADKCTFGFKSDELADIIVSLDAFEHFDDPGAMLEIMSSLLRPDGRVFISFGPTWYHPLGGHLFSVFPWSHLIFSEKALIRWRSDFKSDGATRFSNTAGGLNQMTIARCEKLLAKSSLRIAKLDVVPIRKLRTFHSPLTREFTSAVVKCQLVKA